MDHSGWLHTAEGVAIFASGIGMLAYGLIPHFWREEDDREPARDDR